MKSNVFSVLRFISILLNLQKTGKKRLEKNKPASKKFIVPIIFSIVILFTNVLLTRSLRGQEESIIWTYDTGSGIYGTPVIHEGVLYVGNEKNIFFALNTETGDTLWTFNTGHPILSTAVVCGDIICFESYNVLYGLNLDGHQQWKYTLCKEHKNYDWDFYHSSPYIIEGVAYIGTDKGLVYGIDVENGEAVFKVQIADSAWSIRTTPEVYEDKIFFAGMNGVVYAYNLLTQELVWSYDTKKDITFTGWDNHIQNTLKVYNDHLYFGGKHCHVYSLNMEDGSLDWKWQCGSQWIVGAPVIKDGVVYTGSSNQYSVYALDAITGDLLWQSKLDHRIWNLPVIDGDYIYAPSGSFYVLNKPDGSIKHLINVPGEVMSSAALYDSTLYFGNTKGTVYAVDQYKFNNKPECNTTVTLDDIDFGTIIDNQITKIDTSFYIYNDGDAGDIVTFSFSRFYPHNELSDDAITVDPDYSFELSAHDSQKVTLAIDITGLENGEYGQRMMITSEFNLSQKNFNSTFIFNIAVPVSGKNEFPNDSPHSFFLNQNFPNPFNPTTNLSYQISNKEKVNLTIYNVLGEKVKILVNDELRAGEYTNQWDGKDMSGKQVQSGVYFCRMQAGNYVKIRKLTLIR